MYGGLAARGRLIAGLLILKPSPGRRGRTALRVVRLSSQALQGFQFGRGELLVHSRKVSLNRGVELRFLRSQLVAEFFKHGVSARDRFAIAGLDHALQRGQLVVQLDGEIERILAAAVL